MLAVASHSTHQNNQSFLALEFLHCSNLQINLICDVFFEATPFHHFSKFFDLKQSILRFSDLKTPNWMVSSVDKHKTIGVGGLGFESQAGQIRHSVANGSPPLRRFFGAVFFRRYALEINPATRHTLWRNTASTMKIWFGTGLFCSWAG